MLKRAIRGALLDTDFLIDLNRSKRNQWRQRAEKLLHDINSEELFISSVTAIEFLTGIPENRQAEAQNTLEELYYYATPTYKEAALAGSLRRDWLVERPHIICSRRGQRCHRYMPEPDPRYAESCSLSV